MKRIHLIIYGRVQGVFYREHTMKAARRLGLNGYVRNMPDGTVEVVAEGEEEKLRELVKECKKGSFMANVSKIDVKYEQPTGEFEGFVVEF